MSAFTSLKVRGQVVTGVVKNGHTFTDEALCFALGGALKQGTIDNKLVERLLYQLLVANLACMSDKEWADYEDLGYQYFEDGHIPLMLFSNKDGNIISVDYTGGIHDVVGGKNTTQAVYRVMKYVVKPFSEYLWAYDSAEDNRLNKMVKRVAQWYKVTHISPNTWRRYWSGRHGRNVLSDTLREAIVGAMSDAGFHKWEHER